jgi:galactitol-specific phosphotransferase system IIC component
MPLRGGGVHTIALGHKPSFTIAEILADERLLSAVLLPVADVYPKGTLTAVTLVPSVCSFQYQPVDQDSGELLQSAISGHL